MSRNVHEFHHGPADPDRAGELRPGSPPRLPRVFLPRRPLWHQLDSAAESAATVLVAPSGAGKTLGVAGWLRHRSLRIDRPEGRSEPTWIDADPSCDAEAIAKLLAGRRRPTGDRPPLLVVDDAHLLPRSALDLIEHRLNQDPQSLRLLLITRWDLLQTSLVPQLLGDLTVLRGDLLRLADTEAVPLIAEHAGTDQAEVAEAIMQRANGWCAPMVLAARAIRSRPDRLAAAREFARGDAPFADRAVSEVLASLSHRERHLLLSVAGEPLVTGETARRLSGDQNAPELLITLAADGLLVTRVSRPDQATVDLKDVDLDTVDHGRYRVHPLLAEVIRRRLVAGGVDVEHARATVARAVDLDLARGIADRAFDRLIAINRIERAAELLAADGLAMISSGQASSIARFPRMHPEVVDAEPGTWFPIAYERWNAGDIDRARHWLDRILHAPAEQRDPVSSATARLMRSRLGIEPIRTAVDQAQELVDRLDQGCDVGRSSESTSLAVLLIELGSTQNWLGDLDSAEANLTAAIGLCHDSQRLSTLDAMATSTLALTQFLTGRQHTCARLADEALAAQSRCPADHTTARAALAGRLARFCDVPWLDDPGQLTEQHPADLCARYLARLQDARARGYRGDVAAAEQVVALPLPLPGATHLPPHLRALDLVERGRLASLAGDGDSLGCVETQLTSLGLDGEVALIAGLRAEVAGDPRSAADAYRIAVDATFRTPGCHPMALACLAQLSDALGETGEVLQRLDEAAAETASSRDALAFLGWSRHGTPMEHLLAALEDRHPTPWIHELADAIRGRPDLAAHTAASVPSPSEREAAALLTVRPTLSTRERDVLVELARGGTYADIGAKLLVSENTVKTHVSNVYAKLGACRRGEALAVARGLQLI